MAGDEDSEIPSPDPISKVDSKIIVPEEIKPDIVKEVKEVPKEDVIEETSPVMQFHEAIQNNNLEKVRTFLESGMDPDVQDVTTGKRPLLEATNRGYSNIVKALLVAHANVNLPNIQGTTPLHACVSPKCFVPEIAFLYLEQRKANFTLQEITTGNTPLHILARVSVSNKNENNEVVIELLKEMVPRSNVNARNKNGDIPLHIVAMGKRDDADAVRILLTGKSDVNARNSYGETPLATAINHGNFNMAMAILDDNVDVGLKDRYGDTLLHYAAKKNAPQIARQLLEKGSDVNCKDSYGDTALHLASGRGFVEVVELLLKHPNVCINMQNDNGYTPLMCAVDSNFIRVVELLVKFKCDITITSDQTQKSALDIAKENMEKRNKHEIYEFLLTSIN